MDILKSKLVTTTEGAATVSSGGLNLAQIIAVKRQGLQLDYVSLLNLTGSNRAWSFLSWNRRIAVNPLMPFEAGEEIFVIYKITT